MKLNTVTKGTRGMGSLRELSSNELLIFDIFLEGKDAILVL
jgi:hypothetical protein